MAFLNDDIKQSLEGKFLKWNNGQERLVQLVSLERETKEFNGERKEIFTMKVIDRESGQQKEFTANRSFLSALAKIDDQLEPDSVVRVVPIGRLVTFDDGNEREVFDFTMSIVDPDSIEA